MATKRRMFSEEITNSDSFLDMPQEVQLLYFHLGIHADDDGFVSNPKMVQRVIGAADDAIKILYAKKFLIPFDSGVCVIKHWRINNQIRKDRYKETKYIPEKSSLFIRENGAYTKNPELALPVPQGFFSTVGNQLATKGIPTVATDKVSKGKVRLDKNKHVATKKVATGEKPEQKKEKVFNPLGAELIKEFEIINPACKRMYNHPIQRQACDDLIENYGFERVKIIIQKTLVQTNMLTYLPTITTPNQLFNDFARLEAGINKLKNKHEEGKKASTPKYHG